MQEVLAIVFNVESMYHYAVAGDTSPQKSHQLAQCDALQLFGLGRALLGLFLLLVELFLGESFGLEL